MSALIACTRFERCAPLVNGWHQWLIVLCCRIRYDILFALENWQAGCHFNL